MAVSEPPICSNKGVAIRRIVEGRKPSRAPESIRVRAILLSLVGGSVVLANGLDGVWIPKLTLFSPAIVVWVGLASGGMMIVAGLFLWLLPRHHATWGALLIGSSALSLLNGGGLVGFLFPLGFTSGLVGGLLAVQRSPAPMIPLAAPR